MILITSIGEFLLHYCRICFYLFHFKKKKKKILHDCFFFCYLMLPYIYSRIACPVGLNCDQIEEGEQYSEYSVERNPRAYMSMRDYRNQPRQSQQPVKRNPNEYRSMRDYRNPPWVSAPSYMVCHAPNPGPTQLADPNRVRDARPDTGTLPDFFFF